MSDCCGSKAVTFRSTVAFRFRVMFLKLMNLFALSLTATCNVAPSVSVVDVYSTFGKVWLKTEGPERVENWLM